VVRRVRCIASWWAGSSRERRLISLHTTSCEGWSWGGSAGNVAARPISRALLRSRLLGPSWSCLVSEWGCGGVGLPGGDSYARLGRGPTDGVRTVWGARQVYLIGMKLREQQASCPSSQAWKLPSPSLQASVNTDHDACCSLAVADASHPGCAADPASSRVG
jgi:hypothetical protein